MIPKGDIISRDAKVEKKMMERSIAINDASKIKSDSLE